MPFVPNTQVSQFETNTMLHACTAQGAVIVSLGGLELADRLPCPHPGQFLAPSSFTSFRPAWRSF